MRGQSKSTWISLPAGLAIMLLLLAPQHGGAQNSRPVSPDGLSRPEEVYRPPSLRERQARMEEMVREAAKPRTPEEEKLALEEIAEDFKHIQLVNNRMMSATMSAATPKYGSIAETTGEIRKRAIRIRKNLQLPKVDEAEEKEPGYQQAQNAAQMKTALLALDASIMNFIQNPIFVNPEVINLQNATKARRELEKIINRSQLISKDAEKLKKSAAQPR